MVKWFRILLFSFWPLVVHAQPHPSSPVALYGPLFRDVQLSGIALSKKILKAEARRSPASIVSDYTILKDSLNKKLPKRQRDKFIDTIILEAFVRKNFAFPKPANDSVFITKDTSVKLEDYAKETWRKLRYKTDSGSKGSLISLPYPYIGCGPEANELHYWDSYFILLGLKECGDSGMMENIINNFAYLINRYGHIPATNRTYSLGRSQPPFFSYMIDLLADIKGKEVYQAYLPELEKEYLFWMDGADSIRPGTSHKRVVKFDDGTVMNRYWSAPGEPRPEFYAEDWLLMKNSNRSGKELLQDLGASVESGWENSSRWKDGGFNAENVRTTEILPVDLNCLLHHLECVLRDAYKSKENTQKVIFYAERILNREVKMDFLFWDENLSFYCDYNFIKKQTTGKITLAGVFPFLFKARYREFSKERIEMVVDVLQKNFLFEGGASNSIIQNEKEYWEAPWGAASLQWAVVTALENNRYHNLGKKLALNWVNLSWDVYLKTGRLLNYYDVIDGASRYDNGDKPFTNNFASNNGLLLYFINIYEMHNNDQQNKGAK